MTSYCLSFGNVRRETSNGIFRCAVRAATASVLRPLTGHAVYIFWLDHFAAFRSMIAVDQQRHPENGKRPLTDQQLDAWGMMDTPAED